MAICFELVVNFGDNLDAAWAGHTLPNDGPRLFRAGQAFDRVLGRVRGRMLALLTALDEAGSYGRDRSSQNARPLRLE